MRVGVIKKRRSVRVLSIAAIYLLALAPADTAAAEPQRSATPGQATDPVSVDPRSLDERISDAIELRSEFGLTTDLQTISQLLADPTADTTFGTPLAPKEAANMALRLALRNEADAAITYVENRPDEFGGAYFTQATGETVLHVLPVATANADILNTAIALVPDGLRTVVRPVDHSMNDLLAAEKRLGLRRDDLEITSIGLDLAANGLEVALMPGAKSGNLVLGFAAVPATISYAPPPEPAACSDSSSCTPYRGGIGIFSPQANEFCTWGFYGTRGTSSKYLMTAGHCANLGNTETHLNVVVTDGVDQDTFDRTGSQMSDSMTAHVKGSVNAVSPFNTIFANSSDRAHVITARRATASQVVGDAVCFMGGATGTSLCGTIEATGLSYTLTRGTDGRTLTLTGQIRMSRVTKLGDSGGPVYQGATAYGVLNAIASGTGHMLYSPIFSVETNMSTTTCITSAC